MKIGKGIIGLMFTGIVVLIAGGTEPTDSNGNGKREVSTLDNLLWISTNAIGWGYDYEQTANIDASATSGWNSGSGWSPIGESSPQFTGSYDGNGYTISNLYISRLGTGYIGLFGYCSQSEILNLGLTNVTITGSDFTGALAGYLLNSTLSRVS